MFTKLLYIQSNIFNYGASRGEMYRYVLQFGSSINQCICMYAYMRMHNNYVQNYTIKRIQTNIYCST